MIVFNPLSLYTTFLGWQLYDLIFDAFLQTGLWFLGFLFVACRFLKNIAAPAGATHHAAEYALNQFIYELLVLVMLLAVFVVPAVSMQADSFEFHPLCSGGQNVQTIGNTGSTYDDNFQSLIDDEVKMPLGFAVLQNFIGSLTYGLMQASTCVDGLNNIKSDMISTNLPERVQQELADFKRQCFLEARLNFKAHPPEEVKYSQILKTYGGESDLRWLGSHVFRILYYSGSNAKSPVARYKYHEYPSESLQKALDNKEIDSTHLPEHGFPDCETWWKDIREDLKALTDDSDFVNGSFENRKVYKRILDVLHERGVAGYQDAPKDEIAHDLIAKILIENNDDYLQKAAMFSSNNNTAQSYLASGLNRTGQALKSWTYTPLKREATRQTLPVMQALGFFMVILLMPIIVAFSGCNPKAIGAFCGIFSVLIFINFIWFAVSSLESRLLESVDGNGELVSLVQNIAVMFYFIGPLLLLRFSALWGAGSVSFLTEFLSQGEEKSTEVTRDGMSSGKAAISIATKAAGKIV